MKQNLEELKIENEKKNKEIQLLNNNKKNDDDKVKSLENQLKEKDTKLKEIIDNNHKELKSKEDEIKTAQILTMKMQKMN